MTKSIPATEADAETVDSTVSQIGASQPDSPDSVSDSESLKNLGARLISKQGLMGALILLAVVAFANSLTGAFVHDDLRQIQTNPLFGRWDLATIERPFKNDHWAALRPDEAGDRVDSYYYRPIFGLFLMMGYEVAGRSPLRWHLLTLLLHIAAGMLVFLVIDKSLAVASGSLEETNRGLLAALAAAIFLVHPAQSESVAWISGLVNPLSTVFLLSAFFFYLIYRTNPKRRVLNLAAALALFAMAALSKESALTLVLIVAAYEILIFNRGTRFLQRARIAAVQAAPYALVAVGYLALRYSVLKVLSGRNRNSNFTDDAVLTFVDNLRTLPALLTGYVKIAFFPFDLSFMYGFGYVRSLGLTSFWMPLLFVVAASGLLLYFSKRIPGMKLAAIWMVAPLLPHLSTLVFASDELIHDRYLYVPMVGVGLLLAVVIARVGQLAHLPIPYSRAAAFSAALVLAILCISTFAQNRQWADDESLWANAAAHAPNSRMVHIALGYQAEHNSDWQGALKEYEFALRINPSMIDALNNAAFVNARVGQWDEASRYFERIVSLTPEKAVAHFNLSFAYAVDKRYEEGAREQRLAIQLDPDGPRVNEWRTRLAQLEKNIAVTPNDKPRDK